MNDIRYCPIHGTPDSKGNEWPCPLSDEDEMCPEFEAELARRMHDVTVNGNYFELLPDRSADGERMLQEYRNHEPYGQPQTLRGHRR
jgi:hypothetical protein